MDKIHEDLVTRICAVAAEQWPGRTLVGIAGPPGSGKSTVAAHVTQLLNERYKDSHNLPQLQAWVVGMDGFHYTRAQLDTFPNRQEAYDLRGASWTFDVEAILYLVRELHASAALPVSERHPIYAPSFDHALKDPVANDICIPRHADIVILEGNYLLLDEDRWREISSTLNLKIFINVDPLVARERVAKRHLLAGIEPTLDMARRRFENNDAINGAVVRRRMVACDVLVQSVSA